MGSSGFQKLLDDTGQVAVEQQSKLERQVDQAAELAGEDRKGGLVMLKAYRHWRARCHAKRHKDGRHMYGRIPPPDRVFEASILQTVWRELDAEGEREAQNIEEAGDDSEMLRYGTGRVIQTAIDDEDLSHSVHQHDQIPKDGKWTHAHAQWLVNELSRTDSAQALPAAYVIGVLRAGETLYMRRDNVEQINLTDQPTGSKCIVIGDLHGSLVDLLHILKTQHLPTPEDNDPETIALQSTQTLLHKSTTSYIFNGDLVDRGPNSIEVLVLATVLSLAYPSRVRINRGNHEDIGIASAHGFKDECVMAQKYIGSEGSRIWEAANRLFLVLPICCLVDVDVFVVHGGLPRGKVQIADIRKIQRRKNVPRAPLRSDDDKIFQDLLWSDPRSPREDRVPGWTDNRNRGAGIQFAQPHTEDFLRRNPPLRYVIRSHESMAQGYQEQQTNKLWTVFSSSDYSGPASNKAAVLILSRHRKGDSPGGSPVAEAQLGELKIQPFAWNRESAHQLTRAAMCRTSCPRPKLNSVDKLEYTRDEVLRKLRELISLRKAALLDAFCEADDVEGGRDGLLSHTEWDTALRKMLIPVSWIHLRRYLVRLQESTQHVSVPAAAFRDGRIELVARRCMSPSKKMPESIIASAAPVDDERSCVVVRAEKTTRLASSNRIVTVGGREVYTDTDVARATEGKDGDVDVEITVMRIPYMEMLFNATCAMEDDLAERWAPYFLQWVLDRFMGHKEITEEAGAKLLDIGEKGSVAFAEFERAVAKVSTVDTYGVRGGASGLPRFLAFHLYTWLLANTEGCDGYVRKSMWTQGVKNAVQGEKHSSGRVTIPGICRTFKMGPTAATANSPKTVDARSVCGAAQARVNENGVEQPFTMWDVNIIRSLRYVFSEMHDMLSAFRFMDQDRDTVITPQDLRDAINALELYGEGSAEQLWITEMSTKAAQPEKELVKLFGHNPLLAPERDGLSWYRIQATGDGKRAQAWVRADYCVLSDDCKTVTYRSGSNPVSSKPDGKAFAKVATMDNARTVYELSMDKDTEPREVVGAIYCARVWPLSDEQLRALIRRIHRAAGAHQWRVGDEAELLASGEQNKWYLDVAGQPCHVDRVEDGTVTVRRDDDGSTHQLPASPKGGRLRPALVVTYTQFVRAFFSTRSLDTELADEKGARKYAARGMQGVAGSASDGPWFADDKELWEDWRNSTPVTPRARGAAEFPE